MPVFESEKEFEECLMENESIMMEEFGGEEFINQVKLFGYGTADIISFDTDFFEDEQTVTINVIELKKGTIDYNAIGQVCRYMRAVERFISNTKTPSKFSTTTFVVRGVVIGQSIGSGDVCYLSDFMNNVSVYRYEIDAINGLSLTHEQGWFQSNEDLSKMKKKTLSALLNSFNLAEGWYAHEKEMAVKRRSS